MCVLEVTRGRNWIIMKNKSTVLIITIILTIVIFILSTSLQKKLINYEPKINCLTTNKNIIVNEKLTEDMFKISEIPISLIGNTRVISNFSEVDGLYAKDNIYKNQIALKEQFDTKENLSIYETEDGKEKISIKIQNAENGISYTIRENNLINLYATIRNDYAKDFLEKNDRLMIGSEEDGYTVIKLLENIKVLGAFNVDGIEIYDSSDGILDSIMIPVTSEEAKQINLLREIATFNLTGSSYKLSSDEELNIVKEDN